MAVIAHYKLNDNAATDTIIDETGNHNGAIKDAGGTATSAFHSTTNSRGVGTCLDFEGTDDYIEIADHADFTPALTPFSISAWVYMHDATNFYIATKGVYNTDGEWGLYFDSSDRPMFELFDESVDNCYIARYHNSGYAAYENQWIHIVATYDGGVSVTGIKLYINGLRVDDTSDTSGTFVAVENLTHDVWIGRYDVNYADGLIDNVIIFNTELNEDEIKALYHGGHGTEIVEVIDLDRRIKRRQ